MSELKVNSRLLGLKGVEVHVDDHGGTGRPVVLIQGWPLSGASWSEQIEALTDAGFRVVTYDRRGFGRSDKPKTGYDYDYDYDYDTLADDLAGLITQLDLHDVTLVGFSMGGGEVARYLAKHGEDRLHSVVFAAAVTPMMINTPGNPGGPLEKSKAADMTAQLTKDQDAFYDQFLPRSSSPRTQTGTCWSPRHSAKTPSPCVTKPTRLPRSRRCSPLGRPTSVTTCPRSACPSWSFTATPTVSCRSRAPDSAPIRRSSTVSWSSSLVPRTE